MDMSFYGGAVRTASYRAGLPDPSELHRCQAEHRNVSVSRRWRNHLASIDAGHNSQAWRD